jgi:ABC-type polysaccharide transport system permease subunit
MENIMKTQALHLDDVRRKHFLLLMIVPLLIGFMIFFLSPVHAEWDKKDDPRLQQSPPKQGWVQMVDPDALQKQIKPQTSALATVSQ